MATNISQRGIKHGPSRNNNRERDVGMGVVSMRELSLFTGVGGGLLGSALLGWRTVGAVEIEEYPCRVLEARQRDGCLDEFPIWNMDIRDFNRTVAGTYEGMVDVITAGFPCQPFSSGNPKRLGENDPRNQWPQTIECIRLVKPRFALLENVTGLLSGSHGYFGTILRTLAESGYDARWRVLSAAECGAPHKRDRLWVLAYSRSVGLSGWYCERCCTQEREVVESESERCEMGGETERCCKCGGIATNASIQGWELSSREAAEHSGVSDTCWWKVEPDVGRVANGVASRVDRIKAIGNGQVPAVAATAWNLLTETLK